MWCWEEPVCNSTFRSVRSNILQDLLLKTVRATLAETLYLLYISLSTMQTFKSHLVHGVPYFRSDFQTPEFCNLQCGTFANPDYWNVTVVYRISRSICSQSVKYVKKNCMESTTGRRWRPFNTFIVVTKVYTSTLTDYEWWMAWPFCFGDLDTSIWLDGRTSSIPLYSERVIQLQCIKVDLKSELVDRSIFTIGQHGFSAGAVKMLFKKILGFEYKFPRSYYFLCKCWSYVGFRIGAVTRAL